MKTLLLILCTLALPAQAAVDAGTLIHEYDHLLARLAPNDPQRTMLLHRKADQIYDLIASDLIKDRDGTQVDKLRAEAVRLYQTVLAGNDKSLTEASRIKTRYQLARLLADSAREREALPIFNELENQSVVPRVQQESALYLAEIRELSPKTEDLKAAARSYHIAASLTSRKDLLTYVNYRLAWTEYRLGQIHEAIHSAILSLEGADRESLPQILRDTLLFITHSDMAAQAAVAQSEKLQTRYAQKGLTETLADLYYTSDQREKFLYALQFLNAASYSTEREIRAIDAFYGVRDLKGLNSELGKLAAKSRSSTPSFADKNSADESEKRLFRLTVELDSLTAEKGGTEELFGQAADAYMLTFPANPNAKKVLSGWSARASRPLPLVESWLQKARQRGDAPFTELLRKTALSLAVKSRDPQAMLRLTERAPDRESRYQHARALLERGNTEGAKLELIPLAAVNSSKPDDIAVFSQNILMDLYAKSKDYGALLGAAEAWTSNPDVNRWASGDAKLRGELAGFTKIAANARFEQAAGSQSNESMKFFYERCRNKEFVPKSCENALVLARKLRDPEIVLGALVQLGKSQELADEYEQLGRFSEAARARETLAKTPIERLRVALLYEIGGDLASRDRTLRLLAARKGKLDHEVEGLLFSSLRDASLVDAIGLVSWSEEYRLPAASLRFASKPADLSLAKILAGSCKNEGDGWRLAHLQLLRDESRRMAAISITGKRSAKNFDLRVKSLEAQNKNVQCFLQGSNRSDQLLALTNLQQDYESFAQTIFGTVIPKGLDADTVKSVKAQITETARPFSERAQALAKQIATLGGGSNGPDLAEAIQSLKPGSQNRNADWSRLVARLRAQPYTLENWNALHSFFTASKNERLRAYFAGRLKAFGAEKL